MDRSPKGREIERVEGNPGDIISRGEDITELGTKMSNCADTLRDIKSKAVSDGSQKGKAIDKLKETIGDSHEKLSEAAELYTPVGAVITDYGNALDGCKPIIDTSADECETLWATYESLPGDKDGSTTPEAGGGILGVGGYDKDSPQAKEKAENNEAKAEAYKKWEEAAEDFDDGYDTWETAFDTAVTNIGTAMSGKIKDSRWDNFSGFLDVVTTILSWAALVIGIIALFAGGWILAAIAMGLAALVLLITSAQWIGGKKSFTDVLWAGLAVLPIGKVSHLSKLVHFRGLMKATGFRSAASRVWKAGGKGDIGNLVAGVRSGTRFQRLPRNQVVENILGPSMQTVKSTHYRMFFNGGFQAAFSNPGLLRAGIKFDFAIGKFSAVAGHWGRLATAVDLSGGPKIDLPKWTGLVS